MVFREPSSTTQGPLSMSLASNERSLSPQGRGPSQPTKNGGERKKEVHFS